MQCFWDRESTCVVATAQNKESKNRGANGAINKIIFHQQATKKKTQKENEKKKGCCGFVCSQQQQPEPQMQAKPIKPSCKRGKVTLAFQKELLSAESSHTNINASNKCTARGKAWQCRSQDDYSCLFFNTLISKLFRKCKELETIQCQRSVLTKLFLSLKKIMKHCLFVSKGSFSSCSIIYSLFQSSSNRGAE